MSNQPSEAALAFAGKLQEACLLDVNLYDLLQYDVARLLDAFAAQAVAAERERCLEILCYPRKHFSAAYPDWMVWLIELDIRNGVEQPKRGE